MTRDSVETTSSGGAMVKAVNRKPRVFQTPGEKSYSLDVHETRLRERLLVINRLETSRLERLQRQITSNQQANVGRILRRKDQMRVTLINIASNKRKIRSNVGEFERRLKNGTNSSVFSVELERIRRKEQELAGLHERLQGPNARLLAEHVSDELRNIESRLDGTPSRLLTSQAPSVDDNHTPSKSQNEDEAEATLVTTNQISDVTHTMPAHNRLDNHLNEVDTKMSQANISTRPLRLPPLLGNKGSIFPVTQSAEENSMPKSSPTEGATQSQEELVKTQEVPENKVVTVAIPDGELPPLRANKTKKQKYLALMQQKLIRTSRHDREISNSALQRERHARKRVGELSMKTREDIQGRRPDETDDSLESIKQQEVVTKLQTTRKAFTLPNVSEGPERNRTKHGEISRGLARRRNNKLASDSAATSVTLPPLQINPSILKELKESRLRHRKQTHKLPKLP